MRSNALGTLTAMFLVIVAVVAAFLGGRAALDQAGVTLGLTFSSPMPAGAQLFVDRNAEFSESSSLVLPAVRVGERVDFVVPAGAYRAIRLDPPAGHELSLCSIDLEGSDRLALEDYRIAGSHQLEQLEVRSGCLVAIPAPDSTDPQLTIRFQGAVPLVGYFAVVGWLVLSIAAMLGAVWILRHRRNVLGNQHGSSALRAPMGWVVPLYLLFSLFFGTLYAIATPPGAVADEYAHVTKAVKVSHGVLVGGTGERPFPNIFEMYGRFNGYLDPSVHFSPMQLLNQFEVPVPCAPSTASLPHGADAYSPHLYAVPAAMYALSCSMEEDLGFFLVLSRIGNLVLATLLIALGIWSTLRARWVLVTCALLPMSLYQIASVSADSISLALSFAWIGAVCGVIEGRVPVAKSVRLLLPLALAISISKPGSAWILAAILFARPAYLAQSGSFVPAAIKYLLIPFIIHVVWTLYATGSAAPLPGVDPIANLTRVFDDPLGVASQYAHTFYGDHGIWLVKSAIGALGWLDVSLSLSAYYAAAFCLIATVFMGYPEERPPMIVGAAGVVVAAGAAVLTAAPLFIYWTLPGSVAIMGLQGRYFIPCIAFVLAFAAGSIGNGPSSRKAHRVLACVVPVLLCYALLDGLYALIERYYL